MQTYLVTTRLFKKAQGFTLIEIIVVMAILATFATMALPRMQNKMSANLKKRSRMLSAAIQYVYNQAAFKNQTYRIHYDLEKKAYWIESAAGMVQLKQQLEQKRRSTFDKPKKATTPFQKNTDMIKKPIQLEKGLKFKDIKTEAYADPITSGQAYTHFFPNGYAETTRIRLEADNGMIYSIVVNPLTGRAKVYDYDIELKDRF